MEKGTHESSFRLKTAHSREQDEVFRTRVWPGSSGYVLVLGGALFGYLVLHPLVMLVSAAMMGDTCAHGHLQAGLLDSALQSFSLPMLPWGFVFACFGGLVGWLVHGLVQAGREKQELLLRLAATDGLTGVANRRIFDNMFAVEWDRSRRHGYPLGLVLVDVDYFKKYNDHNGHQFGDECLKKVAAALNSPLHRPGDTVARYGGEEFVVLLPDTDGEGVERVANMLREAVEGLRIRHGCSPTSEYVTVSLGGAAVGPEAVSSKEELLSAADRALYLAKEQGRNRYCAGGGTSPPAQHSHTPR